MGAMISAPFDVAPGPSAEVWESVHRSDPDAMPTQSPAWAGAICRSGGYRDRSRLYTFADGTRAVLPLFARGGVPTALQILRSPPPAWGFGGIVSTRALMPIEIRAILQDSARLPGVAIQIRPNPLHDRAWRTAMPEGWVPLERNAHVLDLDGGFEAVWSRRFVADARNRVRRAEKSGLTVEVGSSPDLIRDFYRLHELSVERWGRHQHEPLALARFRDRMRDPISKFMHMAEAGEVFRLWVARLAGEPIAAILVLQMGEAHYTRGSMDEKRAGETYANYLLHARAIEHACQSGCRHYHMGESGSSTSLARFKSRFGATAVAYAEYRHERFPLLSADQQVRTVVKRLLRFKDA
jgi:hypothetical protein